MERSPPTLVRVENVLAQDEKGDLASYIDKNAQRKGVTAMTGSGKSLSDLAGRSLSLSTSNALKPAFETERSLDKLTANGMFRDDPVSRAAQRLQSSEVEKAMMAASGKIAALDMLLETGSIFDRFKRDALRLPALPFEDFGSLHSMMQEAMGTIGRIDTTAFGMAHRAAAKLSLLDELKLGNPLDYGLRGDMDHLAEPYAAFPTSVLTALGINREALGALSRTRHWADTLTESTARDYAALLDTGDQYRRQFEAMNLAADSIAKATVGFASAAALSDSAFGSRLAGLDITSIKMSLFAGAIDVLGPAAGGSRAAYAALLGGYSSTDMLDRAYWRDPGERARYYRDQDVDEGLIDADNTSTVAVLIDSGVVEGRFTRAGTMTAVVEAGPVKLRIMASRPKMGAFGAVDAFENALRLFV